MQNNFKEIFNKRNRTKYFVHVMVYLLIAAILVFGLLIIGNKALNQKDMSAVTKIPSAFAKVNLEAKSAVVWDVINNRELFSKDSNVALPLASLTKVMTAVTIDGKLNDNEQIKITADDLKPEGDSRLVVGDIWKAKDLRDFTLLTSSNDGAFALAAVAESEMVKKTDDPQATFIKAMNETATKIGLANSKFFNEHGLDRSADRGGAYGSARDMAALFEYTIKNYPEILEATRYKNLEFTSSDKKYFGENTNILINKIPNIIASKTGYTDLAGGNLVIAFDAGLNRPIIISVLGSTEEGRFSDVLQLVKATEKYIHDN
jgi:serine-type D-Ala-D-Ala endopeptidase (penicillin-binding protein 7)